VKIVTNTLWKSIVPVLWLVTKEPEFIVIDKLLTELLTRQRVGKPIHSLLIANHTNVKYLARFPCYCQKVSDITRENAILLHNAILVLL
jgi:hypothetical protein